MEHELSDAGPCRKSMVLTFTPEEVDAALDVSYKEINDYVRVKGFRKGKAPRRTLENRYAKEAASGARQQIIDTNLRDAIAAEKLQVMGQTMIMNHSVMPEAGKSYQLKVEFDVVPEFELPEYKGLELGERPVEVGDDKVDEALDRYRRMFTNYEAVEEPAREGDVLRVDFETRAAGEEIMSMQDQRLRVEGDILFGLPAPDLVEKFTGAKAGDAVNLSVVLPEDHPNPDLRGKAAEVSVTVKSVERGEMPVLDDAFAEGLGMGTIAQFRERIKGNLLREALVEARQAQEDEIVDTLLGAVEYEVPKDLVDGEAAALVDQQRMRLARAGAKTGEAMEVQLEKYRPEAEKQATRKIRWTVMSQKIAEKENITVSNEDLSAQIEALAQSYGTTPAKIVQRIREFDGVGPMMAEILSLKVVQFIIENAKGGRVEVAGSDTGVVNADAAQSVTAPESEG